MSGLWSFREPGFAVGARAEEPITWRVPRAVTQVLPEGVAYQRSLQPSVDQAFWTTESSTTTTASPRASIQRESPTKLHKTDTSLKFKDMTDRRTNVCDAVMLCPADVASRRTACGHSIDTNGGEEVADEVSRDAAVSEVQRSWWRMLNVDVRPAIELPSSVQDGDSTDGPAGMLVADEETSQTVYDLLARVASRGASSAHATTSQGKDLRCTSRASQRPRGSTRSFSYERCGKERPVWQSEASFTGSHPSPASVVLKADLRGENRVRQQEETVNLVSNSVNGQSADAALSTSLAASPAVLAVPSETLQQVPHTKNAPASISAGAARFDAAARPACQERDARVLLRRCYCVWLNAAEVRRIERCAASYHQRLLECVRDMLNGGGSCTE